MGSPCARLSEEQSAAVVEAIPKASQFVRAKFSRKTHLLDMAEMEAVALDKLVECAARWQPNRGSSLWTYAEGAVLSSVNEAVIRETRHGQRVSTGIADTHEMDADSLTEMIDAKRLVQSRPQILELVLDDRREDGWTVAQIAESSGLTPQYVRRLIRQGVLYAASTPSGHRIPDAMAVEFLEKRRLKEAR